MNDELEQAFREGYEKGYKDADKGVIIKSLRTIADHYGFDSQADMLCEESAEYIAALNKLRRTGNLTAFQNLCEELADTLVIALQLRYILGEELIDNIIKQKIQRQLKRIQAEDISFTPNISKAEKHKTFDKMLAKQREKTSNEQTN